MPAGPSDPAAIPPDVFDVPDDELPAWVDPSPLQPRRAPRGGGEHGHSAHRPDEGRSIRARATRARRTKRRIYLVGGLPAVAAVIAALVVVLLPGSSGHASPGDGFVSTFQPGELRSVPGACGSVPAALLTQYLPGRRTTVVPPSLSGNAQSQCDWTLDSKPLYRLLDVTAQAYAPNGLARGDGRATLAGKDASAHAMEHL